MNIFLIDADNLSAGAWVDEAFRLLEASEGALPVRRAYGSAENLKGLADVLRVWAVRPFVNLSLTKNTTDIALAVDAMALACQIPAPQMVVIGSGDADFVPLVVRLRERGIRMVCVSERSKMGREAVSAYDRVILVGPEQALHEAVLAGVPTLERKPRKAAVKKVVAIKVPAKKVAVKKAVAKARASKNVATTPVSVPAIEDLAVALDAAVSSAIPAATASASPVVDVAAILQALPALRTGHPQPLAAVARALLDARLRGKNLTATKVLKRFPQHFALLPPNKPRTVQYTPVQDLT
jgi:hypothetical protein